MPSSQRVALITGCSEPHSLGASLARTYLSRGFIVYATARNVKTMTGLAAEGCNLIALDVVNQASIDAAAAHIAETEGRLDVLINNAGVVSRSPVFETDMKAFEAMLDINVLGPVRVAKAFAPLLIRTANHPDVAGKLPKDRSVVVNIGSVAAWGTPWQVPYAASKGAVHSLSEAMHWELRGMGIHVITVKLAMTSTAMMKGEKPFPTRESPSNPPVAPSNADHILQQIEDHLSGTASKSAMPVASVAKTIVDATLAINPPPVVWTGTSAGVFRYIYHLLPYWAQWKAWASFSFIDQVKRPEVGELMLLDTK